MAADSLADELAAEKKKHHATEVAVDVMIMKKKKLLVVATAGGRPNAEPLFEIAKILHARGYVVEFATLESQECWANGYEFVSKFHILGPAIQLDVEEAGYLRMTDWKAPSLFGDARPIFDTKSFLEKSWPAVYSSLSAIMKDPESRPDFILSDYIVDAVLDMQAEYGVPIAMNWPQMPTNMLPASYIPGTAGLQIGVLTSEHATLWQRMKSELVGLAMVPELLRYLRNRRKMRASMGVTRSLPNGPKPDNLLLVNLFFGLEVAKDTPPNVVAVGPVLADDYPHLTEPALSFVQNHKKIIYVAFGTHVLFRDDTVRRVMAGLAEVLHRGVADGIIWAIRGMARKQLDLAADAPGRFNGKCTVGELLNGYNPNMLFVDFAPQRAVLDHSHTCLFISHCGAASVNEATFHGVPLVTLSVYFDQLQNAMRLRDAGVSLGLDKDTFTADDLSNAVTQVIDDPTGSFQRNSKRMQAISRIASKRKHLAADLIEEVHADHEWRHVDSISTRPPHLQTADVRMPFWKARNWDLYACFALLAGMSAVAIPAAFLYNLVRRREKKDG
ncbi:hypothetical protein AJ80_04077 [Polytolypa hystricis UAMH7299]|uniref:UDP-glycosyltransferases domain-containing protein n=1 Tax=Polytolypa hystricis (strain UAMH7299) TaxID=1447883 RepID=A0A2B7Y592_POLH7|nr:hypothetical protein AJ80_04077 [Polytolypa hystricis UAMH7299]